MLRTRRSIVVITAIALLAACGDESSGDSTSADSTSADSTSTTTPTTTPTTTATTTATTVPATTTTVATTSTTTATTVPAVSTTTSTPATTTVPAQQQLAIWPASDVVFNTPEAAANDFLANVFGEGPVLGTFRAGDQRSGEIEVFATEGGTPIGDPRSLLLLRQLGPSNGWFVLAAVSDVASVTAPESMATVPAAPLTVEGVGTGFEATIVVSAFVAGRAATEFDREIAMAGNFGEVLPYSVTLDLAKASPGDVVVLLVRGGTGLETDPGDFGAVPVVVG